MTGTNIAPSVAKGYRISADGKRTTLFLRKGMKWSDGAPFTADDFVFWFEDMYQNKEVVPSPTPEFSAKGKPGRVVKVDETTVAFEFDAPHFLFPKLLAGDTAGWRRPVAPTIRRPRVRPLRAGALPEAVPAEIQFGRGGERES